MVPVGNHRSWDGIPAQRTSSLKIAMHRNRMHKSRRKEILILLGDEKLYKIDPFIPVYNISGPLF